MNSHEEEVRLDQVRQTNLSFDPREGRDYPLLRDTVPRLSKATESRSPFDRHSPSFWEHMPEQSDKNLTRELEELRRCIADCKSREQTHLQRIEELTQKVSHLEEEKARVVDELARQSAEARHTLVEANGRAAALEGRLREAYSTAERIELATKESLIAVEDVMRGQLRAAVQEWETTAETLSRRNSALTAKNDDLSAECRRLTFALEKAKLEFAEEIRVTRLRAQEEEFQRLSSTLQTLEERQRAVEAQTAETETARRSAIISVEERLREVEAMLGQKSAEGAVVSAKANELEVAVQSAQLTIAKLEERLRGQTLLNDKLQSEIGEGGRALERQKASARDELESMVEHFEREKEAWDRVREAQFTKTIDLERKLEAKDTEYAHFRAQLAKLGESVQRSVTQTLLSHI